jgi:ABC-2 type transport system ATP-binding protein
MQQVLNVQNLTKEFKVKKSSNKILKDLFFPTFQKKIAVDQVTFSISKGESVAFLGSNGAGKTTTTKMLTGLIYPTSGDLSVLGYFPFDRKRDFLKRIGLVMGGKAGLNWDLTPNQSFDLLRQIYQIPKTQYDQTLNSLINILNGKELLDIQIRKLSLGERMKMELIGAILHNPEVLFLDEPTIGLDIVSKRNIRRFLRKIQHKLDITLLLTSHDMGDIEEVCDRVIVLSKGKIIYDNSINCLMEKYNENRYVQIVFKELPSQSDINDVISSSQKAQIYDVGNDYYSFRVKNRFLADLISAINQRFELADIDISSVPLEEIMAGIFEGNMSCISE